MIGIHDLPLFIAAGLLLNVTPGPDTALVMGQSVRHGRRGGVLAALGVGAQYGVALPFSRKHEAEADIIGLQLMAQAGFDPRESVGLWQNMAANSGGSPPEFLSTHPSNQTRIEGLQARIPKAMPLYQQAQSAVRTPNCG